MEAISRFAGSVAHDLNNFLTTISLSSRLLLDGLLESDPLRAEASEIKEACDRLAGFTKELLKIAFEKLPPPEPLSLGEAVLAASEAFREKLASNIQLVVSVHERSGQIRADAAHLIQLVNHLLANAADALSDGGQIKVRSSQIESARWLENSELTERRRPFAQLTIEDSGKGIAPERFARLFEPFNSDKGKGRGMGLTTVYGIVKRTGGQIKVSNSVSGTKVEVLWPLVN